MAALRHRSTLTAPANYAGIVTRDRFNLTEAVLALKSLACSAGYTVKCSGDGNSVVSTSGDVFTSTTLDKANTLPDLWGDPTQDNSPNIARSFYNDRPHFTLQRPGGLAGELSFQIVTNVGGGDFRIKYSSGGYNASTATATNQPSPTTGGDEIIVWGGGSNASPTGSPTALTAGYSTRGRLFIGVNGDTTAPYLYLKFWSANNPIESFCLMWDSMLGTRPSVTPNNSALFVGPRFTVPYMADEDKIVTPAEGYTFVGRPGSSGTHRMVPTIPAYNNSGYGIVSLVGALGHDLLGGRVRGIPGEYVRRAILSAPDGGIYGRSNAWRWNMEGWDTGRTGIDRDGVSWMALDDILVRVNMDDVTGTGGVKFLK